MFLSAVQSDLVFSLSFDDAETVLSRPCRCLFWM